MGLFLKMGGRLGGGGGFTGQVPYDLFKEALQKVVSRKDYDIFTRETSAEVGVRPAKFEVWALGKEITAYVSLGSKPPTFDEDFTSVIIVDPNIFFSASEVSDNVSAPTGNTFSGVTP